MIGKTCGHYRLLERIGAGGMGEVYRAHDQHLDRDVAVKILPPGFLADEPARKRFRREALALSKLNHPNIATVFDFDTEDGVDFLAMELIDGTRLSDRVHAGPLPDHDIVRLGLQLAEGLAAAHGQGVIHQDLKPGNLMITPDGRLKILDFGLAILVHPKGDADLTTRSVTETTSMMGTLPYMSPEQLRGQPVDARSDLYAAGAVLYEMATGRRPFPQSQSAELIGAILHQSPARPGTHNQQLPSGLERVVMKALDKEPAQRYQSARELVVALEGLAVGVPGMAPRTRGPAVAAGAGALAVVLLAGLTIGFNMGGLRDRVFHRGTSAKEAVPAPNVPVRARRSVAVLGFKNLSGRPEDAWLSTALSEMLTTELAAGERLRTIPGENVSQMKINLSLADADSYGKETLSKIRVNLGTDDVVLGSYIALGGGQIRLDLRLQDAVVGETLAAVSEKGSETQIDDLVSRAGSRLREKLGAGEVSAAEAIAVKATLPSNLEAVRLYAAGLVKLRIFDALSARDLFEKAIAADPDYSLAHSALAGAWSSLGYDERAKAEAKRAFELSARLSREDGLAVEGRYRETTSEREKAVEIYRTLWGFFPDNLDYGLRLAAAQTSAGEGRDALITIEALRKLPAPTPTDPRIDLAEASAASLSDFRRQQLAAQTAAAKGSSQGARLLAAKAQVSQGDAFRNLGNLESATRAYASAQEIFAAAGDRASAARAVRGIGNVLLQRGDLPKAEENYAEALAIQRSIGDKLGMAASLQTLGVVRERQADLPTAKKFFEDSLEIYQDLNDRSGVSGDLNNIGAVLQEMGDFVAAKRMYERSLVIKREIGDRNGIAILLSNIAQVLADQPDLRGAKRMNEEALTIRREIGNKSGAASTLRNLGSVLSRQGDLPGARNNLEEALALQNEIGEKGQAASTREDLAGVLIDEGQAATAETLARGAAEEFHAESAGAREASALAMLAFAEFAQGKVAEAQKTIDLATKLLAKSDNRGTRLFLQRTAARIRATSGNVTDAAKSLEAARAEAAKYHLVSAEFEARLALGEIDMKSGKTAAGRTRLAALEKEATAKGFLLIARKARAAASSQ